MWRQIGTEHVVVLLFLSLELLLKLECCYYDGISCVGRANGGQQAQASSYVYSSVLSILLPRGNGKEHENCDIGLLDFISPRREKQMDNHNKKPNMEAELVWGTEVRAQEHIVDTWRQCP